MARTDYLEIAFLPWTTDFRDLRIGPVRLWPYPHQAKREIPNVAVRQHLRKYFRSYVNHDGKPVSSLTVCSHGKTDFRQWSPDERRDVRRAIDGLAFATIAPQTKTAVCANNATMGPPSADVFELTAQRFQPGDDGIAVRAGDVLSGGWRIGQIKFPRPWATGGALGQAEVELVEGLGEVLATKPPAADRIFQSLEWYRLAHVQNDQVSDLSRLVMMVTAFEVLLEFPPQGKRRHFVDYVERQIAERNCQRDVRTHENGRQFNLSLAACWAWDFYVLRSRVVHGDTVNPNELVVHRWLTHLIVADLIFLLCVETILFDLRILGHNERQLAAELRGIAGAADPLADWERNVTRMHFDVNRVHRALGWM